MTANNQQLQQIKSYCQGRPDKTVSFRELEQNKQTTNKPNYLPWILGGIGIVGLVGVIAYFLMKKKGGKE